MATKHRKRNIFPEDDYFRGCPVPTLAQLEAQQPASMKEKAFHFYRLGLIPAVPLPEGTKQRRFWEACRPTEKIVMDNYQEQLPDALSARLLDGLLTEYAATRLHPDPAQRSNAQRSNITVTSRRLLLLCGVPAAQLTPQTPELEERAKEELKKVMAKPSHAVRWRTKATSHSCRSMFSIISSFSTVSVKDTSPFSLRSWSAHQVDIGNQLTLPGTLDKTMSLRPGILRALEAQDTEESRSAEVLYRVLESWRETGEARLYLSADDLLWSARVMREELPLAQRLNLLRPGLDALQAAGGLNNYQLSEEGLQVTLLPQHPTEGRQENRSLLHDLGLADHLIDALLRGHSPEEFRAALEAWHQHRDNADPANPGGLLLWLLKRPNLRMVDTKHMMGLLEPDIALENQPDLQSR